MTSAALQAEQAPGRPAAVPGEVTVILGPQRRVSFHAANPEDVGEAFDAKSLVTLRESTIADVAGLIASGKEVARDHALLVGHDPGNQIVAAGAYARTTDDRARIVCAIHPTYRNLGLGTFVLRRLAEQALQHGIHYFDVEITEAGNTVAPVLRDCGFGMRWHMRTPLSTVSLDLRHQRPGWRTPECWTETAQEREAADN